MTISLRNIGISLFLATKMVSASNWLMQCSPCIDQSLYSDMSLKSDIRAANTSSLYEQLKQIQVRQFEHIEQEFFNRFFPRTGLGVVAQELSSVIPSAVSLMPERRWSSLNGTQMATKNVHMVREAHLLFVTLGATQEIVKELERLSSDYWGRVAVWGNEVSAVKSGLDVLSGDHSKTRTLIEDSRGRLILVERDSDRVSSELREVASKIGDLRASTEQLRSSVHDNKHDTITRIDTLTDRLLQTKNQLERSLTDLQLHVDSKNSFLADRVSETQNTLSALTSEYRTKVSEVSQRISGLASALFNLHRLHWETNNRLNTLESEFHSATQSLQGSQNQQSSEITKIQTNISSIWEHLQKEAHADLMQKTKEAELHLQSSQQESHNLKLKYENDLNMLAEQTKQTEELQDRVTALKQKRDEAQRVWNEQWDLEMLNKTTEAKSKQQKERLDAEKEMLAMKLAVERERLQVELSAKIEQAKIEAEARLQDKRENEDINLREMRAKSVEEREHTMQAIREVAKIVTDWLGSLYGSPENLLMAVGSVVGLAAGIYIVREAAILMREQLNKHLGKPSLVRITSRTSKLQDLTTWIKRVIFKIRHGQEFNDVVLAGSLFTQIKRLANATKTAKERNAPLLHCMFYGPPGTGKTMVAKRFAEYSGLEYAIMCGGDVAPLGDNAVTELHNLFKWVQKSKKGVLLFIDEAESFLGARHGAMSEHLRNALAAMLYHTGTASSQFMMILATNRPGDLDAAVLDRIDESIEFGLPDLEERKKLVKMYYDIYVGVPTEIQKKEKARILKRQTTFIGRLMNWVNNVFTAATSPRGKISPLKNSDMSTNKNCKSVSDKSFETVAIKTKGFSGREISKLFMSLQTHVYSLGLEEVTEDVLLSVTENKVAEHDRSKNMQKHGYTYDANNAQKFYVQDSSQSTPISTASSVASESVLFGPSNATSSQKASVASVAVVSASSKPKTTTKKKAESLRTTATSSPASIISPVFNEPVNKP